MSLEKDNGKQILSLHMETQLSTKSVDNFVGVFASEKPQGKVLRRFIGSLGIGILWLSLKVITALAHVKPISILWFYLANIKFI